MEDYLKIAGLCLCAAILAAALNRRDRTLSMALGLLCCVVVMITVFRKMRPAAVFLKELAELSGLGGEYLQPLVKAVGVGLVTQIACAVCEDGGHRILAKSAEIGGVCAAIVLTLPLLRASLELIRQMMGG